jgi:hypothetical protein
MRHDYSTEQFQAFRGEVRDSFWGQIRRRTQHILQQFLEANSEQQMAEYLGLARYERSEEGEDRVDSRNGFYERDYVTPLGAIRLRVRRTRKRSFLPRGLQTLERRAPEVAELIRQAFLRGISTRAVGRVVLHNLLRGLPLMCKIDVRPQKFASLDLPILGRQILSPQWVATGCS